MQYRLVCHLFTVHHFMSGHFTDNTNDRANGPTSSMQCMSYAKEGRLRSILVWITHARSRTYPEPGGS